MPNIPIPSPQSDQNQLNLLQMVNLVSYKLSDKPASETSSPSKQLITNELNEAQRQLAIKSDTWTWLFKNVQIQGYDYNISPVNQSNFTAIPVGNINLPALSAQLLTGLTANEKITAVILPVISGTAQMQAFICADNNGQPNFQNQLTQSNIAVITAINSTLTFQGNIVEPKQGINYWLVLQNINSGTINISANTTAINQYYTSIDIGITWTAAITTQIMYTMIMTPRNYLWNLTGPNDVDTPQNLHTPMGPNKPSVYVLLPMPYDYFQQSTYGNYLLGVEFFTVSGYNNVGQPNIIIPMNLKIETWEFNYKAKVRAMVDDGDMPQLPSSYRTILVLMATLSLMAMGYGTQDAEFTQELKEQLYGNNKEGRIGLIQNLMRDYNNKGEQYINIIGMPYTPEQLARVKALNDKYRGPQRLGVLPIGH